MEKCEHLKENHDPEITADGVNGFDLIAGTEEVEQEIEGRITKMIQAIHKEVCENCYLEARKTLSQ
jgi:hypothetical protein